MLRRLFGRKKKTAEEIVNAIYEDPSHFIDDTILPHRLWGWGWNAEYDMPLGFGGHLTDQQMEEIRGQELRGNVTILPGEPVRIAIDPAVRPAEEGEAPVGIVVRQAEEDRYWVQWNVENNMNTPIPQERPRLSQRDLSELNNSMISLHMVTSTDVRIGDIVNINGLDVNLAERNDMELGIVVGAAFFRHDYDDYFNNGDHVSVYRGYHPILERFRELDLLREYIMREDLHRMQEALRRRAFNDLVNDPDTELVVHKNEINTEGEWVVQDNIVAMEDAANLVVVRNIHDGRSVWVKTGISLREGDRVHVEAIHTSREFVINDFLTVKLEDRKTHIYVKGKLFSQCKYLLLNLEVGKEYPEIKSIDEAAKKLNRKMETNHSMLLPSEEFQGHCSNLQAWAENGYDIRLLHSNLSLPLAVKLVEVGEKKARMAIVEEVTDRCLSGTLNTIKANKQYFKHFEEVELEPISKRIVNKMLEIGNEYMSLSNFMDHLQYVTPTDRQEIIDHKKACLMSKIALVRYGEKRAIWEYIIRKRDLIEEIADFRRYFSKKELADMGEFGVRALETSEGYDPWSEYKKRFF